MKNNILCILRALPGAGKSTLAERLRIKNNGVVFSTDNYHMINGKYVFQASKLSEYHQLTFKDVENAMLSGEKYIILDNTNINALQGVKYYELSKRYGYEVEVISPETKWSNDFVECANKTIHGVPVNKIKQMARMFSPNDLYLKNIACPITTDSDYKFWTEFISSNDRVDYFKNNYLLLPIFKALKETEQNPEWHPEGNVLNHTTQVLERMVANTQGLSNEEKVVMHVSALLHDVGKFYTTWLRDGKLKSPGHAQVGAEFSKAHLENIFCFTQEMKKQIIEIVEQHMFYTNYAHNNSDVNKWINNLHHVTPKQMCLMFKSDTEGRKSHPNDLIKIDESLLTLITKCGLNYRKLV